MPKTIFNKPREGLLGHAVFLQSRDATNKAEIDSTVQIISARQLLAYEKG